MTVFILGAGPTGMAIVDGLVDANRGPFVILEKVGTTGGLAQTLYWDDVGKHDLGPHKIFSLDKNLVDRVENLLPATEWLTRDKISSIYMKGHYLPYPPSPFSLAAVFGLVAFIKMVIGYGLAKVMQITNSGNPKTFEEDLVRRLGRPLYEKLFKPLAEKLWGNPRELDVKLSKGRVQTPSLVEVIGLILKIRKKSEFEALTFRYPKGGLGRLWEAIEAKTNGSGEFLMGCNVTGLDIKNGVVQQIRYISNGIETTLPVTKDDYVVSTLPLAHTIKFLSNALPDHFEKLAEQTITLNDLLLVYLHIDTSSFLDESWVFIPDPEIVFHRISEQESFDPEMTPNGTIVCCEIMSSASRPMADKSNEDLYELVIKGLSDMGFTDFNILKRRIIKLPKSYPVFKTGFESGLAELVNGLDQFENFRSLGRQGAFNYIGTLDAMDIGYGFVKWYTEENKQAWQTERERTNHFPVLD